MRIPARFRAETKYAESVEKKANANFPIMARVGDGGGTAAVAGRANFYWVRLVNDGNRLTQCYSLTLLQNNDWIYVRKARDRKLSYYEFVSFIQTAAGGTLPPLQGEVLYFVGASGANEIILPDNIADALHVEDDDSAAGGSPEYMRFVTTDGAQAVIFNLNNDDVNFVINASALAGAFDLDGATGAITLAGPSMQVPDDWWEGFGAAAGRIVFDSTPTPDEIRITAANAYVTQANGDTRLYIENTESGVARYPGFIIYNYGGATAGHSYCGIGTARGTKAAPALVPGNQALGAFVFYGHTGAAFAEGGRLIFASEAAWAVGNTPTYVCMQLRDTTGTPHTTFKQSMRGNTKIGQFASTDGIPAQLYIDQYSTTAGIPVVIFDQADLSEEFIELTTTVGAGNPIDTAALGAYYGKARVMVTGVGYKVLALYEES